MNIAESNARQSEFYAENERVDAGPDGDFDVLTVTVTYAGHPGSYIDPPEPVEGIADVTPNKGDEPVACGVVGEVDVESWDGVTWEFTCPKCDDTHEFICDMTGDNY